jgi:hypothetical protein
MQMFACRTAGDGRVDLVARLCKPSTALAVTAEGVFTVGGSVTILEARRLYLAVGEPASSMSAIVAASD